MNKPILRGVPKFAPAKPTRDVEMTQITLPMTKEMYQRIQSEAGKVSISMKEFCRQAITFAIDNIN